MGLIKSHFDRVSVNYRSSSESGLWSHIRRGEAKVVSEMLPEINAHTTALDLGSGSGFYSDLLRRHRVQLLTCVDFSEKMLAKIERPDYLKISADIEEFRNNEKYDIILCAGALEFTKAPQKVFENVSSMLKMGGSFILLYPRKNYLGRLYRFYHKQHGFTVKLYSDHDLRILADHVDFRLAEQVNISPFSGVVRYTHGK